MSVWGVIIFKKSGMAVRLCCGAYITNELAVKKKQQQTKSLINEQWIKCKQDNAGKFHKKEIPPLLRPACNCHMWIVPSMYEETHPVQKNIMPSIIGEQNKQTKIYIKQKKKQRSKSIANVFLKSLRNFLFFYFTTIIMTSLYIYIYC